MEELTEKLMPPLAKGITGLQLSLSEQQLLLLIAYVHLLLKWNKAFNLTAITDPYKIITHHILDSLSIVPFIQGPRVIDIGSGAGLPGIPCAIVLPHLQFVLLDGNGKKTRFMTQALGELKISNATAVQARVEDYQTNECFNTLMARAFASVEKIVDLTKHLSCPGGQLLLMKGIYPKAELQNIGNHAKVSKLSVPGVLEERHLVCIKGLSNE